MDKSQNFFDPYNFNMQNFNPPLENGAIPVEPNMNPNAYYEGQCLYYKYLTQMMEYRIKCREYENINNKQEPKK